MGLLLNVSRRNLDRVLYFAQYVTTHVDEEARQRALKRLDDELEEAELRLEKEMQGEVADATLDVTARLEELEGQLAKLNATFDDRLAEITDEVVREAKMMEQRLENMKKNPATEDFLLDGEIIVQKGETIGREHAVLVQEITTDRLTRVQHEHEEDHQSQVAALQKEVAELRSETQAVGQEKRDFIGMKQSRLRTQYLSLIQN